jgi:DNA-binding GntR family transcriptional regulator
MSNSLKQIAYQHLRSRLLSGELQPGHRISPDASARELGISQTPVREAIGLLESDGLVEQVPNMGAFVRRPDRRELADLYDVRILLEGFAADRAARRIRKAELAELRRALDRMRDLARAIRDSGDANVIRGKLGRELAIADATFHLVLLRVAGNARVLKIVDDLQVISRLMSFEGAPMFTDVAKEMAFQLRQHWQIFHAIARRDPKTARRCMTRHLRPTKRAILEQYDARQAQGAVQANPPRVWNTPLARTLRRRETRAAKRRTRAR